MINGLALCAGNGGLEAALHLVLPGYRTICAVERQAYAAAAFVEWMEKAGLGACPVWDDVTTFDPDPWCGLVDILSAGYPCQPFSYAGKGLCENDPRHLWPYIYGHIRVLMPAVVWLENVKAHLIRGFSTVRNDLERIGYRVTAGIFSAAEVGAPHLRERLFILGLLANGNGSWKSQPQRGFTDQRGRTGDGCQLANSARVGRPEGRPEPEGQQGRSHASFSGSGLGDADGIRCDRRPDVQGRRQEGGTSSCRTSQVGNANRAGLEGTGHERPTSDGRYQWPWPAGRGEEQYEWEKPRLVESGMGGTTYGVGARNEQLLCLGNGVVPVAGALAFVSLWEKLKRGA